MENNLQACAEVYRMLEDGESKDIYLKRLNFLVSGDFRFINDIVAAYLPEAPLYTGKTLSDLKASLPGDRKIVLYGAGSVGRKMLPVWQADERFAGFCSQTKEKQENGYCGYPVMSPEDLLSRKDMTVIISSIRADQEIRQILEDGEYPREQVYRSVDYIRYEDPEQYFPPDFMAYTENEVLIDAGCFDLNTSLEMRRHCGSLKKVYAFEPDPECYEVCLERKRRHDFHEMELLPMGVWSERATLSFRAANDGSSSVCADGNTVVPVAPIDEVADPADKVTMIKMDVEGAELEALKGARKMIQKDRPKLAVCIYHKPEDMTEIPLYIKKLAPEYKLYIRHHTNCPEETVLYAIP